MGIFGPSKKELEAQLKARKEADEEAVRTKLKQCPYLDMLIDEIKQQTEENPWIAECQSYYDSRKRIITFGEDLFEIKWRSKKEEYYTDHYSDGTPFTNKRYIEEEHKKICYGYTKNDYVPMHGYGELSTYDVISIWAEIVLERLSAEFPKLRFTMVPIYTSDPEYIETADKGYHVYVYEVPQLTWKDWF